MPTHPTPATPPPITKTAIPPATSGRRPHRILATALVLATYALTTPQTPASAETTTPVSINCPSPLCTKTTTGTGETAALVHDAAGTLYTTHQNGEVHSIDVQTGHIRTISAGLGNLRGIALDKAGHAYVGTFDGNLYQVDLHTGIHRILATGLGPIQAVARDTTHTYTTGNDGNLTEVTDNGHTRTIAEGIGFSQHIALDGQGTAFTTDMMSGRILRLDLTTGHITPLAFGLYEPTSITLAADGCLYFTQGDRVTRLDLTTGTQTRIATLNLNTAGFSLDTNGEAWAASQHDGGSIWRISKLPQL